jgi:cell wall-associated NlpC family hydrolase
MKVQTGSAPRRRAPQAGRPSTGRMIAVATAMLGGVAVAMPLAAQGPGVFEVMASRKQESTAPLFGGISLAHYHGPLGIRFSGALNLTTAQDSAQPVQFAASRRGDCHRGCRGPSRQQYYTEDMSPFPAIGGWNADVDLVFAPVRAVGPLRSLLLGFSPYAFAGVGGYGARPVNAADTTRATWSLGGGAHHELLGWLGVGAEARYRQPFGSDSAFGQTWQDKLEYRVGLTISFGRHHAPAAATLGDTVSAPATVAGAPCGTVPCGRESGSATIVDPRFASRVLDVADGLVDTPFAAGGTTPRGGFDAAGFVRYVFGQQGVSLPRTARDMAAVGGAVSTQVGALRAGDLLFFANDGTNINHVAIYAGRDRIIHATASGNGVRYDTLGEGERGRWFADHLVSARRISAGDASAPNVDVDPSERPDRAPRPQGASR